MYRKLIKDHDGSLYARVDASTGKEITSEEWFTYEWYDVSAHGEPPDVKRFIRIRKIPMPGDEWLDGSRKTKPSERLTLFFYLLVRNHLPHGKIESILEEVDSNGKLTTSMETTHEAIYAQQCVNKLMNI